MQYETVTPEQKLRDFITKERSNLSDEVLGDAVRQVAYAREQFSRYSNSKKEKKEGFTYVSKQSTCRKLMRAAKEIKVAMHEADLMFKDELQRYAGNQSFIREVSGILDELSFACEGIEKTIPSNIKFGGRPVDRIIYDWVLNMARIYEDLFHIKKIDIEKMGKKHKFVIFLDLWSPDELPMYWVKLTPRTIKRALEFRSSYKDDLRNTFTPPNLYPPNTWKKPDEPTQRS
jgi:hypothetical protein